MGRLTVAVAIAGVVLVILTVIAFYGESNPGGTGILSGTVSIGPIMPVCRLNDTSTVAPAAWASNQILVESQSGKTQSVPVNWTLSQGCEIAGTYRISLAAGSYRVDLSSCMSESTRSFGCAQLPKTVVITSNSTTTLDISIDTGIR